MPTVQSNSQLTVAAANNVVSPAATQVNGMWSNVLKEDVMFPDINEIRRTRKKYNWQMAQSGLNTFRDLGKLEADALKAGTLAQKHKELIALGISISNSCYG